MSSFNLCFLFIFQLSSKQSNICASHWSLWWFDKGFNFVCFLVFLFFVLFTFPQHYRIQQDQRHSSWCLFFFQIHHFSVCFPSSLPPFLTFPFSSLAYNDFKTLPANFFNDFTFITTLFVLLPFPLFLFVIQSFRNLAGNWLYKIPESAMTALNRLSSLFVSFSSSLLLLFHHLFQWCFWQHYHFRSSCSSCFPQQVAILVCFLFLSFPFSHFSFL